MKKVSVDKWCISIPSSLSISHTAHGFSIVTRLWGMLLALSIGCATKKQHFCLDPIGVLKKSIFQKSVPRKQRLTVGSTLECCFYDVHPLSISIYYLTITIITSNVRNHLFHFSVSCTRLQLFHHVSFLTFHGHHRLNILTAASSGFFDLFLFSLYLVLRCMYPRQK